MEEHKISRELDWEELSDTQKIERMYSFVKNQKRIIENLKNNVEKLTEHRHGVNGEIFLPFSSSHAMPETGRIREGKYF